MSTGIIIPNTPTPVVLSDQTSVTSPIAAENWYIGDVTCITKSQAKHEAINSMDFDAKLAYMKSQFDASYNYIPESDDQVSSWGFSRPGYEANSARERLDIQTQDSVQISLNITHSSSTYNYVLEKNSTSPTDVLFKYTEAASGTLVNDLKYNDIIITTSITSKDAFDTSGYLKIGDEIIKYSLLSYDTGNYVFSGIYRGTKCTVETTKIPSGTRFYLLKRLACTSAIAYDDLDYLYSAQSNFLGTNLEN